MGFLNFQILLNQHVMLFCPLMLISIILEEFLKKWDKSKFVAEWISILNEYFID